jgi:hypothetical protein
VIGRAVLRTGETGTRTGGTGTGMLHQECKTDQPALLVEKLALLVGKEYQ